MIEPIHPKLTIVATNNTNAQSWVLTDLSYRVGRHPSCDIILDSLEISRYHCVLERTSTTDHFYIFDGFNGKPSTAGTFIHTQTIQQPIKVTTNACDLKQCICVGQWQLKPSDRVEIAKIKLAYELDVAIEESDNPTFY